MKYAPSFSLTASQVPDPPRVQYPVDVIRWAICVMDPDDYGKMKFLAGCLAYALSHEGGLTDNQMLACKNIVGRIIADWQIGALLCQVTDDCDDEPSMDLESVQPEGSA